MRFFFLLTTAAAVTTPPLTNSRIIQSGALLLSPVLGEPLPAFPVLPVLSPVLSPLPVLSPVLSPVLPVSPSLPPGSFSITVFSLRFAPQTAHSSCFSPVSSAVAALSTFQSKLCAALSALSPQVHSCQCSVSSCFHSSP